MQMFSATRLQQFVDGIENRLLKFDRHFVVFLAQFDRPVTDFDWIGSARR